MKFFIGLVAIGVLIIAANSYFFEPYQQAQLTPAQSQPSSAPSSSAQGPAQSQSKSNQQSKQGSKQESEKESKQEPKNEPKQAQQEDKNQHQQQPQASTDEQMPVIVPDGIGYETKEGASHKEFASKYRGYRSIAQNPRLAKAVNGAFVGEVIGAEHSYAFELQVDAVIDGDSFMGQLSHKLISDGIVLAGQEGQGDIDDLTFNDAEEVVFTDIGGLPEQQNHEGSSASDKYYIYKINFTNLDQPYLTLSRFDGTAIKNIGKGLMRRQ